MHTRRSILAGTAGLTLARSAPRAFAADQALKVPRPTVGVVVPQLLIEFWNNYLAFMKVGSAARDRFDHHRRAE